MAIVDESDFDALCDARTKLFVSGDPPAYDATLFARLADLASDIARQWAHGAGYDIGSGSASDAIKMVALAELVPLAYARRQREVPPTLTARLATLRESVQRGDMPLSDSVPRAPRSIGGTLSARERSVFSDPYGAGAPCGGCGRCASCR